MNQKGFTLIELIIVSMVVGIIALGIVGAIISTNNGTVSYGYGGIVETRCIDGLKFTVSGGHTRQIYDQFGHGVVCTR
jgi:prepilin-type N-terminal cleavage/methylation domain-containing protein